MAILQNMIYYMKLLYNEYKNYKVNLIFTKILYYKKE